MAAGDPNKEQICAEPREGVTPCAAQEPQSSSATGEVMLWNTALHFPRLSFIQL